MEAAVMIIETLIQRAAGSPLSRALPPGFKTFVWKILGMRSEITMYGSRVALPDTLKNNYEFRTVTYQKGLAVRLEQLLKPGMTFCDVGANVGVITLLAARLVGPRGKVYAFEPIPQNTGYLKKSIASNGYRNIHLREAAAADFNGAVDLHLSNKPGQHSMFELNQFATGRSQSVPALRLDSLPELASVDVMKIDTEGAEVKVLKGLGAYRPAHIFVECNEERLRAAGSSGDELRQTFIDMGYRNIDPIDTTRNKDDWHVHGLQT
jgi:FkbM family methyltransferase